MVKGRKMNGGTVTRTNNTVLYHKPSLGGNGSNPIQYVKGGRKRRSLKGGGIPSAPTEAVKGGRRRRRTLKGGTGVVVGIKETAPPMELFKGGRRRRSRKSKKSKKSRKSKKSKKSRRRRSRKYRGGDGSLRQDTPGTWAASQLTDPRVPYSSIDRTSLGKKALKDLSRNKNLLNKNGQTYNLNDPNVAFKSRAAPSSSV
jgi:hypothetical protein